MPEVFQAPRRSRLSQFLGQLFRPRIAPGTYEPSFNLPRLRPPTSDLRPLTSGPAHGSASEARLAVCRRMHPRRLWARIRRGTWSRTSLAAAWAALNERAQA